MAQTPPGWYPDGSGDERWWDGDKWTEHTVSPPTDIPAPDMSANAGPSFEEESEGPSIPKSRPAAMSAPTADPPAGKPGLVTDAAGTKRYWDGKKWGVTGFQITVGIFSLLLCCGLPVLPIYLWRKGKLPKQWGLGLAVAWLVLYATVIVVSADEPAAKDASTEHAQVAHENPTPSPAPTLLFITDQKDGDSFVASDGNEYRLGLVNAPEGGEACDSEAAAFTHDFLADGFTADTYASDTHGRKVAEIFDKNEQSLNVALAKSGLGNDTFLAEFRHENEDLARRLDAAFAAAPTPDCLKPSPTPAPAPAPAPAPVPLKPAPAPRPTQQSNCMVGYSPCLPIVGDLDCGEIGHSVTVTGSDPYDLDRDGDGIGCD